MKHFTYASITTSRLVFSEIILFFREDFVWDFFVYTNSPATSVFDVANYASWLDDWRFSQLFPGDK